jgi:hypothetical protein
VGPRGWARSLGARVWSVVSSASRAPALLAKLARSRSRARVPRSHGAAALLVAVRRPERLLLRQLHRVSTTTVPRGSVSGPTGGAWKAGSFSVFGRLGLGLASAGEGE